VTALNVPRDRVTLAKVIARAALGAVWIYEGLVPKLLFTTRRELDLVARSHLYWPTPRATLVALAVGEIIGGIWLLTGRAERAAAALSLALLAFVGTACAVLEPSLLYHPFGGLSKNLGLIGCALVVLLLSDVSGFPKRDVNAKTPRRQGKREEKEQQTTPFSLPSSLRPWRLGGSASINLFKKSHATAQSPAVFATTKEVGA
jgi:uncharacterized membrane protein YphA (DoxX/SURF4 family)